MSGLQVKQAIRTGRRAAMATEVDSRMAQLVGTEEVAATRFVATHSSPRCIVVNDTDFSLSLHV